MIRPVVNLIAASGEQEPIDEREGDVPWSHDIDNKMWFYKTTRGGSLIVGARTARALGWTDMQTLVGGSVVFFYYGDEPDMLIDKCAAARQSDVWICGGIYTYKRFMPYVNRAYIACNVKSDPAYILMPPLWSAP